MTNTDNARAVAEEQSKQGTFSFLDRLNDRNYPTEDVEIYLDEKLGHEIEKLRDRATQGGEAAELEAIEAEIEALKEKLADSRYIVHLQGISVEKYDSIVDEAQAMYPLEYRESRNPLTAKLEREVIENEDREQFFRTRLWGEFITSIEDNEGNVDTNITQEFMALFLGHVPIAAQARIGMAVNSLRMVTDWMDEIQGEDFLAKS